MRFLSLASLGLLTTGCLSTAPRDIVCTAHVAFGLNVNVRDSITGFGAGRLATVTAEEGSYAETLLFMGNIVSTDSLTFFGAPERAGTYRITVTKAGYQSWTRVGVQVLADECHVQPAIVEVRLQPATP